METPELAEDAAEEPRLPHLPSRLVQVVVSPGRLFEILREKPRSWDALLLGILFVAAANFLLPVEVWEGTLREQLAQLEGQMPGDITTAARTMKVFGSLGVVVAWPFVALLTAGIYSLIFLFGFAYEGRFGQYFSVACHALLVAALSTLLVLTPLRIWTGSAQFTLNLGAFAPGLEEGTLATFLQFTDLFNLWVYALVGLGAAVIDGGRKAGYSMAISVGFGVLLTLVIAALIG